jgi:hypothetical protein
MKKITVLLAVIMTLCMAIPAFAADITMILDGKEIVSDVAPEVKNGTTFVPVRVVIENLNADVAYVPANDENPARVDIDNYLLEQPIREVKTATAQAKFWEHSMTFYDGAPNAYVNYSAIITGDMSTKEMNELTEEKYPLLAAPYIKNNRMMVPLRFIAERIGFTVDYADGKIVMISGGRLELDGVAIKDMLMDDDYVTNNRDLIDSTIDLLQSARGEQCSAVSDYAYVTHKLTFRNAGGEIVAIWQFAAPKDEGWQDQPFSALYLHDRLNDVWYTADPIIFDDLYNDRLGNSFLPPYYDFTKLAAE